MDRFSQTRAPRAAAAVTPSERIAPLYKEHFEAVLRSVRFFGVPARDAEDVTHDVFVQVCVSLASYDPWRPFGPWVKTIAYRTAQRYLRNPHSRPTRPAPTEEGVDVMDTAPSPHQRRLVAEMQRIFIEVMQELEEDRRMVYLMNVADEIPVTEIAASLGLLENTVRSRLARAHKDVDAAVARRRTVEERRQSALAPLMFPAMLADAARKGLDLDPALKALVWSQLARVLGLGIIGKLAPLSGAAIAAGAALLVAGGLAAGALLHAGLAKPAPAEAVVHADTMGRAGGNAMPGGTPSASATASAAATAAASATVSPSTSASAQEADAGAQDTAALIRAENAILTKAREAMGSERYEVALRELKRHERLFPYGKLAEQRRELMRVVQAELRQTDGGSR